MEHYSAIKNDDILSFAGKCMELENFILSEVTQTQMDMHGMYSLGGLCQGYIHKGPVLYCEELPTHDSSPQLNCVLLCNKQSIVNIMCRLFIHFYY